jgi:hypothetical protein
MLTRLCLQIGMDRSYMRPQQRLVVLESYKNLLVRIYLTISIFKLKMVGRRVFFAGAGYLFVLTMRVPRYFVHTTLQRTNTENWKQIFPEKELRGLSSNFHIHVSVSDLYTLFPGSIGLLCYRKYVYRSWEYIHRSQTHECGNWD